MAYAEGSDAPYYKNPVPPLVTPVVEYHDRVRWGPIFAGIVVSIAAQLVLSALGAAIGLTAGASGTAANTVGLGVGIWAIISLLIALFLGSWVMASTCGPMNNKTAMLNGTILWATTLAVSAWLLASGVSGTFGIVASNAGEVVGQVQQPGGLSLPDPSAAVPNVNPEEAQQYAANAAKAGWSFLFGTLLGLVAALIGSTVGARKPRVRSTESVSS
ncbi:MAG: hypothetical protein HC886_11930 [Leptolyngbyaceae cyanobacterium SM1_1_3]|nr:hypothetical protein [Leptolyngbyaceae cyanobacterium SM1_1_3]NJM84934.1 hypothetical protein [Leptolyngbyaceae cyanobacterium RM2_2_21]NJN03390.1 hypothetical protein [Leptolyngbyaceae cyanobacterium RM1_1_2]NJO10444.1 hypothetical protein [Leptolyngbyaceae cyanobacterium SL_1_1]